MNTPRFRQTYQRWRSSREFFDGRKFGRVVHLSVRWKIVASYGIIGRFGGFIITSILLILRDYVLNDFLPDIYSIIYVSFTLSRTRNR